MHASLVEWWNTISLRTKITSVTVLLLSFGLVVSGLGTMLVLRDYLISDIDNQLANAIRPITATTVQDADRTAPTEFIYARLDANGDVERSNALWRSDPPDVARVTSSFTAAHLGHAFTVSSADGTQTFRVQAKALQDGNTVVLGIPLAATGRLVARLFTIFFLFGIVVVVIGAVLTRLLVAGTLVPLRQVETTAAAIADGDFGQRLGNTTANTEVARLNRSLNRMLNRIDRALADRARTIDQMRRFVGDASHELRTPLVSVRGYAELYRMGALQTKEDVAQAMDRIEREAIRLGALVTDLLALARLDEAKPLVLKPVELLPIAHDAALDARALAPRRTVRVTGRDAEVSAETIEVLPAMVQGADADQGSEAALTTASRLFRRPPKDATTTGALRTGRFLRRRSVTMALPDMTADAQTDARPEPQALPLVLAEEDKIRQVLANIIGNAMRYTPADSPIEIGVYADAKRGIAVLEVVDHGDGIPPQIRDKIFQRFWRADDSRTRDTGGSGLGLAIVAAIVQAHQGAVGISETPGGGATFRVTLPLLNNDRDETDSSTGATDAPLPAASS